MPFFYQLYAIFLSVLDSFSISSRPFFYQSYGFFLPISVKAYHCGVLCIFYACSLMFLT